MKNSEKFDLRKFLNDNKIKTGTFAKKEFLVKTKNAYNDTTKNIINEASIKDKDLKVGSKFDLPNGEKIEIKKSFIENTNEDWVGYIRSGGTGAQQGKNENSVKQLRQF